MNKNISMMICATQQSGKILLRALYDADNALSSRYHVIIMCYHHVIIMLTIIPMHAHTYIQLIPFYQCWTEIRNSGMINEHMVNHYLFLYDQEQLAILRFLIFDNHSKSNYKIFLNSYTIIIFLN